MKLKWFGQSCFLMTSGDGVRIVMGSGKKLGMQEVELSKDNLGQYAGVIVLKYE